MKNKTLDTHSAENSNSTTNRRDFLKLGTGTLGALLFSGGMTKAFADSCGLTPPQTSGPFYPGEKEFHFDNDLTLIAGNLKRAAGQVIYLRGTVMNGNCNPIHNANVEIWQACATGKYNNSKDPNPAAIDKNFKYWGEANTHQNGKYAFKTIIPGAYPADEHWMRPPHIHFKVSALGYHDLITQMYFKGNKYNDADLILKGVHPSERGSVIVDFKPSLTGQSGALEGTFNITLKSIR